MVNEIQVLLAATGFIIILLFIILTYLVIRKTIENRQEKKIGQYKQKYNSLLFSSVYEGQLTRQITVDSLLKIKAVEDLIKSYSDVLEGESEKSNLTKLAELYLGDYYKKSLRSRRWSIRMNALYHIEDFRMENLEQEVVEMGKNKRITKDELVIILRILSIFQYKGLHKLINQNASQLSEFEYRSFLMKLNVDEFDQFVLSFYKSSEDLQVAILEVIRMKNELNYVPFVESVFHNSTGELRLRALKTLAGIGYVKEYQKYIPLCKAEKWQERMLAAKLFGTLKEQDTVSCLIDLLHDRIWWVRSQAAQSLMLYPNGREILQHVLTTTEDSFARDMAWEWINKGEI
ncbi:HEAT repeat domain-containing protein [Cytobacillus sp. FJAT-54145]|uniref:HEAT repeat domain-containing protein n=1 Tax=Cytobacillus spartinae TaxID=3299023 RepID=A0ABW6KFS2_9BACI